MNKFTVQGSNYFLGLLCCLFFCCFLPKNTSAQVSITTPPVNSAVCVGATAQFSVVAVGVGTATVVGYQWYKNNVLIPSAISSTYTTPSTVGSDNNDQYTVEVECSCGSFTMSSAATLTVNQAADITSGPFLNQNKCEGESITLSVTAVGTITGYQWKKGTTDLMGQTGPSLTLNNLAAADAGQYSVEARAACGNESYGPNEISYNATNQVAKIVTTDANANVLATRLEYSGENVTKVFQKFDNEKEYLYFEITKFDDRKSVYPDAYKSLFLGLAGLIDGAPFLNKNNATEEKYYDDLGVAYYTEQRTLEYNSTMYPTKITSNINDDGSKSTELSTYIYNCK